MNLYTADLMVIDRMHDRHRAFKTTRLAALARGSHRDVQETGWRERIGRSAGWFRVIGRHAAV